MEAGSFCGRPPKQLKRPVMARYRVKKCKCASLNC